MSDLIARVADTLNRPNAPQIAVTIADPSVVDCPMVYANEEFLQITGYQFQEVEGLNCRFLQGAETDRRIINKVKSHIATGEDADQCLVNYRKNGSQFYNLLSLRHLDFGEGRTLIMGCQYEVRPNFGRLLVMSQLSRVDLISSAIEQKAAESLKATLKRRTDNAVAGINAFLLDKRHDRTPKKKS